MHSIQKQGNWLHMAEMTRSLVARQCVSARIASKEEVKERRMIWQHERNQLKITINWRCTAEDARMKLKRFYPVIEQEN
jgi:hypothetical protein